MDVKKKRKKKREKNGKQDGRHFFFSRFFSHRNGDCKKKTGKRNDDEHEPKPA
jgi:hypothetical protein